MRRNPRRRAYYCRPAIDPETRRPQPTRYIGNDANERARWFAQFRAQIGETRQDDDHLGPPSGQIALGGMTRT